MEVMHWQPRFKYSVSEAEVEKFVDSNACARKFLNRHDRNVKTYEEKATGLARLFRWLKKV
jgi:hypothetical protein